MIIARELFNGNDEVELLLAYIRGCSIKGQKCRTCNCASASAETPSVTNIASFLVVPASRKLWATTNAPGEASVSMDLHDCMVFLRLAWKVPVIENELEYQS